MISVNNFSKYFGEYKVVDNLAFDVNDGEVFAFLGANGSGKTTTIRALLGIYAADEGELLVKGRKYNQSMVGMLGYLPEERGLYVTSRVLETLAFFGEMKGLSAAVARKRSLDYLDRIGLSEKANAEIKKLSSGQQQKIQLGIAVINEPELLILDEPTKGLDPLNRTLLMDMLLELNKKGSTIVFITHQMEEVEKIADRLVMIKEGERVLYGELNEVKRQFGNNTIRLSFRGDLPVNESLYKFSADKNQAEITPNDGVTSQQVLESLVSRGIEILNFEISTPSLNEIFIQVSKGESA